MCEIKDERFQKRSPKKSYKKIPLTKRQKENMKPTKLSLI